MLPRCLITVVLAVLAGCSVSPVQRLAPLHGDDVGEGPPIRSIAQDDAQPEVDEEEALARKAQNPIGAYWNIPFENNFRTLPSTRARPADR